jgi:hypothetical protein
MRLSQIRHHASRTSRGIIGQLWGAILKVAFGGVTTIANDPIAPFLLPTRRPTGETHVHLTSGYYSRAVLATEKSQSSYTASL